MNPGEIIASFGIILFFIVFGFFGWLMHKEDDPGVPFEEAPEPEDDPTPAT